MLLSIHSFDLPSYVLTAFRSLAVNVDLVTVLHIEEFTTHLVYAQTAVPAHTDSSLTVSCILLSNLSSWSRESIAETVDWIPFILSSFFQF